MERKREMEQRMIDARGLACPLPVVNAKKAVGEFKEAGTLTVLVDNEIALQNLQKFAAQKGFAAAGTKKAEKEYQITIQVAGGAVPADSRAQEELSGDVDCHADARKKGLVVAISSNVMGSGDDQLGRALMKAFIFALTQQDLLPETILCYNGGAFLTCEDSESLEDFRTLEAEGVKILTCGTCLDFYGLKEKLAAGAVTNMYEIAETLEQAVSVVRP